MGHNLLISGWHKGYPEVELRVKVPVMQRWRRNPRPGGRKGWHKGYPEVELRVKVPVMKWWGKTPRWAGTEVGTKVIQRSS